MNYSCVIVDDEPLAHSVLLSHIHHLNNITVVKQCYSAEEAFDFLNVHLVDILLLDIEMPEVSGINLLQRLPQRPVTIFTTAFLQYSLEGFELGVMDYLVKPIRFERFEKAIRRTTDFIQLLRLRSDIDDAHHELLIKTGAKKIVVNKATISHVQSLKDYVIIYTETEKFVVRSTLKEMQAILGTVDFIRVHKSFLVARPLARLCYGNRIEFGDVEIPVGRKYKKEVE